MKSLPIYVIRNDSFYLILFHCCIYILFIYSHLTHHYLAAYSLGANKDRLQAIYNENASYQRERPPSIVTITEEIYAEQLSHHDAYTSYLEFFKIEIDTRGMIEAIIYWLFLKEEKR